MTNRGRKFQTRLAPWLHIYSSLLGLAVTLFFSVTSLTLNHPDWLWGDAEKRTTAQGELPLDWLQPDADVDKLPDPDFTLGPGAPVLPEAQTHAGLDHGAAVGLLLTLLLAWWFEP